MIRSLLTHRPYTLAFATVISLLATCGSVKAAPLRIMPLGDSITAGYTDNPHWTVDFEFGYRSGLYTRLTKAGYDFTFVGGSPEPWVSKYGDPTRGGTYKPKLDLRDLGQDGHEGYGGWTIGGIDGIITDRIKVHKPDIILLMIGTNQRNSKSPADLSNLVGKIVTHAPDAHLIVAQIIPIAAGHDSQNESVHTFNTYIRETLVPTYAAKGANVSTVDLFTMFLSDPDDPTSVKAGTHADNAVHPSTAMSDKMAQAWFDGIEAVSALAPGAQAEVIDSYGITASSTDAYGAWASPLQLVNPDGFTTLNTDPDTFGTVAGNQPGLTGDLHGISHNSGGCFDTSSDATGTAAWLKFDLGQNYNLDQLRVWNGDFFRADTNNSDRFSANQADLYYSSAAADPGDDFGANWTLFGVAGTLNLTKPVGSGESSGTFGVTDEIDLNGIDARWLAIKVNSTYGQP